MDLTTAKQLVITDTRDGNPDREITDREIIAEIRWYGSEEIEDWIKGGLIETREVEDAYRAVTAATDDEIAARCASTRVRSSDTDDDSDCL